MKTNKLIFIVIISSLIGGLSSLWLYTSLEQKTNDMVIPIHQNNYPTQLANINFDTSKTTVPLGLNFVGAANKRNAVVHIRTKYEKRIESNYHNQLEEYFRDFFNYPQYKKYHEYSGAGSGVIISNEGHIITNNHVINDATSIEVLLNDNRSYVAKIIGQDPTTDLAVLKIEESNLDVMKWGNSEDLNIGEWVLAIGNPFQFRSTVTAGIVSAKARNINILRENNGLEIESFIQTDAAVNPGNSGGALVNLRGELVGINTAIMSPTGAYAGYSFSVPVSLVKKVYEDLIEFGIVQRAFLGVSIQDVNAELAKQENLNITQGIYINSVVEKSGADEAGLLAGNVIIAVNNKPVYSVSELQEQIALYRPGDKVNISYIDNGKTKNTTIELKNRSNTTEVVELNKLSLYGAEFEELTDTEKQKYRVNGGIKIKKLDNGKLKSAGIKSGFIITKIDRNYIKSIDDLATHLKFNNSNGILIEGFYPDGTRAYYGLGW